MGLLSGKEIQERLNKTIFIEPFDEKRLNPNSYNLRLDNKLLVYDTGYRAFDTSEQSKKYYDGIDKPDSISRVEALTPLDMKINNPIKEIIIPDDGYILFPGRLYLGKTIEKTKTHGVIPAIEGRSSIGRLGLYVHITAGFGDVGFDGYWTLELHCIQPIRIYPNVDICQIYYNEILGEYTEYSSGKYQGNNDVQASMLYRDFH